MKKNYVPFAIPENGPNGGMRYACPACGRPWDLFAEALACLARCRERLDDVSRVVREIEIEMHREDITRLRAEG